MEKRSQESVCTLMSVLRGYGGRVEQNEDFTAAQNKQQIAAFNCSLRSVSLSILERKLGRNPPPPAGNQTVVEPL